jgi:YfiH family protein
VSAGVSVHRPQQVHSALVLPASAASAEPWPQADGLVSDAGGQSLWVCGADCTPVLLADPVSGRVAACHAGWRGVAGGIVLRAIERLEAVGCRRRDLLVALGPAVAGERYQVERSVAEQVAEQVAPFAELERVGAVLPDAQGLAGHVRLDIRAAQHRQLLEAGLDGEQISICPLCTVAEPLLFHSWRRDQQKAVQWSGIVSQQLDPD